MATPKWVVKSVQPKPDYTLLLQFADGKEKIFDAMELLDIPIYEELKNPGFFLKARVEGDTVCWSDEIDIAPEYLYEKSVPVND